jgi:hypothetical protein
MGLSMLLVVKVFDKLFAVVTICAEVGGEGGRPPPQLTPGGLGDWGTGGVPLHSLPLGDWGDWGIGGRGEP